MELKDTVAMMTSEDYKERFKAEYNQLRIRIEGLTYMLIDWGRDNLDFEPATTYEFLRIQLRAMETYAEILEERARIEGIDLYGSEY